jgi:hypothetical protein
LLQYIAPECSRRSLRDVGEPLSTRPGSVNAEHACPRMKKTSTTTCNGQFMTFSWTAWIPIPKWPKLWADPCYEAAAWRGEHVGLPVGAIPFIHPRMLRRHCCSGSRLQQKPRSDTIRMFFGGV